MEQFKITGLFFLLCTLKVWDPVQPRGQVIKKYLYIDIYIKNMQPRYSRDLFKVKFKFDFADTITVNCQTKEWKDNILQI